MPGCSAVIASKYAIALYILKSYCTGHDLEAYYMEVKDWLKHGSTQIKSATKCTQAPNLKCTQAPNLKCTQATNLYSVAIRVQKVITYCNLNQ